jgi:hypothetical protein
VRYLFSVNSARFMQDFDPFWNRVTEHDQLAQPYSPW